MICLLQTISHRSRVSSICYVAYFVRNRRNALYSFTKISIFVCDHVAVAGLVFW